MCGIAGIYAYGPEASPVDQAELVRLRDAMINRGPDGEGAWISSDRRVGLAHRRLSIIDLSEAACQPMVSASSGNVIVFNGEIYNYRSLRAELMAEGFRFASASDTEVLLKLYERDGDAMIGRLRGMYSFVIWDDARKRVFAARDPFGIKPFYYCDTGRSFRFASQVKALTSSSAVSSAEDPAGHVGFFLFGFVPEPYTLYKSIRSLPAGHSLSVELGGSVRIQCHFDVAAELARAKPFAANGRGERLAAISEAMADSVRQHMVSDVPVGIFLSAGIDSACIAAAATRQSASVLQGHTLGFAEYRDSHRDETVPAANMARALGMAHSIEWVGRSDFEVDFHDILRRMDQPSIDGVNTYFVSKITARSGSKVALSGLGGDELFGGYPSFRDIPRSVRWLGWTKRWPTAARAARVVSAPLIKRFTSPKYASLFEYGGDFARAYLLRRGLFMPWELPELLDGDIVREGWAELQPLIRLDESARGCRNDFQRVAAMELAWYMRSQLLRDADWAGMAHSLEIRVPFVDPQFFRTVASMSVEGPRPTKADLAEACLGDLAAPLMERQKTGFSIPVEEWARETGFVDSAEGRSRGWAKAIYREHVPRSSRFARERVLVFRVGNLGDTLVSMPAIGLIRERHKEANLALLAHQTSRPGMVNTWDVLEPTGWFDSVFTYRSSLTLVQSMKERVSLVARLRRYGATTAYNLAPRRGRWQRARDRMFFSAVLGIPNVQEARVAAERLHARDGDLPRLEPEWKRLAGVVEDAPADGVEFRVPLSIRHSEAARGALRSHGMSQCSRFVAIAPGSKMPAKMWSKDRYQELGQRILERFPDVCLLVLGGNEDRALGDYLVAEWGGRSANLAGDLDIYAAAALLRQCQLFVGNDTGTMHLAAMSGVRCVAIFSARDFPGLWEPFGSGHVVIRKAVACAGCMLEVCSERNNLCLEQIAVDDVFGHVSAALA